MIQKKRSGATAERYVGATLEMIVTKGGSRDVNLRAVSRKIGCAHTNVYNYFEDFQAVLWEAYRKALDIYADYLEAGLDEGKSDLDAVRGILKRLTRFPLENPGLFRFIASDPMPIERMPAETMAFIGSMRNWLIESIHVVLGSGVDRREAERISEVLLAYISGESFDVINGRYLPKEDITGRELENSMHIFHLMARDVNPSLEMSDRIAGRRREFPRISRNTGGGK